MEKILSLNLTYIRRGLHLVVDKLLVYDSNASKQCSKDKPYYEVISMCHPCVPDNDESW
jgi:hypothetical protein